MKKEDIITGVFKSILERASVSSQLTLAKHLLGPADSELLPKKNVSISYGLRADVIPFSATRSESVVFDRSRPDLWIKVSENTQDRILIVIEIKIGRNYFSALKNVEQLDKHLDSAKRYKNVFIVGISDGPAPIRQEIFLKHHSWTVIIDNLADLLRKNDVYTYNLLMDFKSYKERELMDFFDKFPDNFSVLLRDAYEQQQLRYDDPFHKISQNVDKLLNEMLASTAEALSEIAQKEFGLTPVFEVGPDGYFLIRKRTIIHIQGGIDFEIQFRGTNFEDTHFMVILVIYSPEAAITLKRVKENEALFLNFTGTYPEGENSFEIGRRIDSNPNQWVDPLWVVELKKDVEDTIKSWYAQLQGLNLNEAE